MPIAAPTAARRPAALAAVTLAAVVFALALDADGAEARTMFPPGLRDVATASGANTGAGGQGASAIDVDVSSGPAGEDPQGTVDFSVLGLPTSGPPSCMKVTGNVAILEVDGPVLSVPGDMIIRLTDNGGNGADRFEWYPVLPEAGRDFDCETGAPGYFGGTLAGRAIVQEAPPGPATRRACRQGNWADYGFKSRRHCYRYVQRTAG